MDRRNGRFLPLRRDSDLINTPLTNCGHIGVYWTASADASNGYGYEVYVTSDWGRYRQGATAYGNSVRCVKEK